MKAIQDLVLLGTWLTLCLCLITGMCWGRVWLKETCKTVCFIGIVKWKYYNLLLFFLHFEHSTIDFYHFLYQLNRHKTSYLYEKLFYIKRVSSIFKKELRQTKRIVVQNVKYPSLIRYNFGRCSFTSYPLIKLDIYKIGPYISSYLASLQYFFV